MLNKSGNRRLVRKGTVKTVKSRMVPEVNQNQTAVTAMIFGKMVWLERNNFETLSRSRRGEEEEEER